MAPAKVGFGAPGSLVGSVLARLAPRSSVVTDPQPDAQLMVLTAAAGLVLVPSNRMPSFLALRLDSLSNLLSARPCLR